MAINIWKYNYYYKYNNLSSGILKISLKEKKEQKGSLHQVFDLSAMRKHISPSATYDVVRKYFTTHVKSSQHLATYKGSGYCSLFNEWSLRMGYILLNFTTYINYIIVDFTIPFRSPMRITDCPMMQKVCFFFI